MLIATNPFTEQRLAEYPSLKGQAIHDRIQLAQDAFPAWRDKSFPERAQVLKDVAAELRKQKDALAQLMADEMGKPLKEGGPEVEKSAWCAEHYAEHAEAYLADEHLASDASESYVSYEPLGVLLGILPWNAPLWLAFRYLAPSLMAGNTCTLKHDPNVPGCAQAICDAFKAAGAPDNIVVNLPLETPDVETAIRAPQIMAVSFTGSAPAGSKVAAMAASEIKPSVLELGGSDPFIVMADADLEKAMDIATLSRIINAGQSCIAAKRIMVEKSVHGRFVEGVKTRLEKLRMGDPNDAATDIGPLARKDLQQNLHRQVQATIEAGASCLLGGELPDGSGFFYPPTLLTDVSPAMCAFHEETFGPVMVVIAVDSLDQAIELANQSEYGLGAALWMADTEQARQAARRLYTGQVAINGIVKTDPRLPSGGVKRSGFGRELGPHGIKEFVNAKQIWIK
ncbi:NAD-dependent succinate-semialdehyde dehydrogenase [Allohahella marinimesophila]|uniref:NAD-dependent succinate-semialdehyde dehydrogenase n=1 Tax=Allohahella marinimesophila TaxID=1054972 RepID=A0ABP7Q1C6_9GAMM